MFLLHIVFILGSSLPTSPSIPTTLTGEYRTLAACKVAADTIQRAAGRAAILVSCTQKG